MMLEDFLELIRRLELSILKLSFFFLCTPNIWFEKMTCSLILHLCWLNKLYHLCPYRIIIMFISSNYLIVSSEHRVHFNTNVCSRFCCTPRPFQAYGYPLLLLYMGGSVFILVFRQECVPNAAVYSEQLVLWHYSIGSPFSSHTRHYILFSDFSLSSVFTAVDFGIVALHRDRLFVCSWFLRASSTSANNP